MVCKQTYDTLPLIPAAIAECVAKRPYTGQEMSIGARSQSAVDRTEAVRQRMTPQEVEEFIALADHRCRAAFEVRADWFMKCVRARGERGRDQLYVWLTHWLAGYLANPETFRRSAAA